MNHVIRNWSERLNDALDKFPVIQKPDRVFFLLGHIRPRHDIHYSGPSNEQWHSIQCTIAWYIGGSCWPEDISTKEWWSEDGESYFELILRKGCIVGSFDRELTDADLQTIGM